GERLPKPLDDGELVEAHLPARDRQEDVGHTSTPQARKELVLAERGRGRALDVETLRAPPRAGNSGVACCPVHPYLTRICPTRGGQGAHPVRGAPIRVSSQPQPPITSRRSGPWPRAGSRSAKSRAARSCRTSRRPRPRP